MALTNYEKFQLISRIGAEAAALQGVFNDFGTNEQSKLTKLDVDYNQTSISSNKYVGFFGDSRAFLSVVAPGGLNEYFRKLGLAHWIQAYSLGTVSMPRILGNTGGTGFVLNGGVAGDTTVQMLARLPAYITNCVANGIRRVVLIGGTNDRSGTIDLGTTKKNIREMVRMFQKAGIAVDLISETPRGTGSSAYELSTQAKRDDHYAFHIWCETVMPKMCRVHNMWDLMIDPTSGNLYYPKPGYTIDGIHFSCLSSQAGGALIGPVMAKEIRQLGDFLESNAAYNASTNPLGTLITNPLLDGTTGTWQGGYVPVAGSQVATGWNMSVSNFTGLTVLASKEIETLADGNTIQWQKYFVSGTASTASQPELSLNQNLTMSQLTVGDVVKATALVRTEGTGISNMGLGCLMTPPFSQKLDCEDSDPLQPWPSINTGILSREMPNFYYTDTTTVTAIELKMRMSFTKGAVVNATFWVAKCGMFKVTY
jgi:lysophospholipase L1-like esterase